MSAVAQSVGVGAGAVGSGKVFCLAVGKPWRLEIAGLTQGTPQGAILSPLLYPYLYTAGLTALFTGCEHHRYTDDVQLYKSFYSTDVARARTCLDENLHNVGRFAKDHLLALNPSKTQAILFCPKHMRNQIQGEDDIPIAFVLLVKNLGLLMDGDSRFQRNTSTLLKRTFVSLKIIYHNRNTINQKTKKYYVTRWCCPPSITWM
ncbi:Reverse transcriptase (RNA-dependent DNA polymerase) [Popillia japonica]|uniref:Reverse transcriptase (RNA-dependent DNA polymerase) n=1 Tax=Popillia japonica TaxID=7064 RepID=A0AAW1IY50_POPJA